VPAPSIALTFPEAAREERLLDHVTRREELSMHSWLTGHSADLGIVAAKAALMYGVAVLGLRVAQRRTLAQWTAVDFAAAVAVGAIVGRTALASNQSFVFGAVALVTLLAAHAIVMAARFDRRFAKLVDHRVRVLVVEGRLRHDELRICGLTENDVIAKLRQQGVHRLGELRYVLYETKGDLTIVRTGDVADAPLVAAGLRDAAGFDTL
jgi:uncharacterized membrane protein YcaP (DUF421 family)